MPRKIMVGIFGGLCLVGGIVMIVTPGPGIIFIPLGLLLLASEFKWAERWLSKFQAALHKVREKWHGRKHCRSARSKS